MRHAELEAECDALIARMTADGEVIARAQAACAAGDLATALVLRAQVNQNAARNTAALEALKAKVAVMRAASLVRFAELKKCLEDDARRPWWRFW